MKRKLYFIFIYCLKNTLKYFQDFPCTHTIKPVKIETQKKKKFLYQVPFLACKSSISVEFTHFSLGEGRCTALGGGKLQFQRGNYTSRQLISINSQIRWTFEYSGVNLTVWHQWWVIIYIPLGFGTIEFNLILFVGSRKFKVWNRRSL